MQPRYLDLYHNCEKRYVGLHPELFYAIIPTIFSYFLLFCYLHIFNVLFTLVYVFSSR